MTILIMVAVFVLAILIFILKNPEPYRQKQPQQDGAILRELKYFCTKDSGYYVSVWPKDQNADILEFDIAGMTYRDKIMLYSGESVGTLEAESDNQYDKNAIKVLAPDGYMVGYVPRDTTARVREFTSLPCRCYFYIGYYTDSEGTHYYSDCYITRKNL